MDNRRAIAGSLAAAFGLLLVVASAQALPIPSSNLQLWLASDYGVETTGNAPAANNNPIIAWRDKSGNNNDALVAAPVGSANSPLLYQPTYKTATLNGKPTLLFDLGPGNLEYARLALASPLLTGTTDFSIFAVVKFSSTNPGGEKIVGANYGGGNSGGIEFYSYSGAMRLFKGGTTASASDPADGNYHLVAATRSGNTISIYIDNQLSGALTYGVGTVTGLRNWNIGNASDYATGPLGNLAEQIVYDRALTAGEQAEVTYYLAQEFALSAIPEPASIVLASAGAAMLLLRRRGTAKAHQR